MHTNQWRSMSATRRKFYLLKALNAALGPDVNRRELDAAELEAIAAREGVLIDVPADDADAVPPSSFDAAIAARRGVARRGLGLTDADYGRAPEPVDDEDREVERLADALDAFKRAALALDRAWPGSLGDAVEGYPDYLPSFDEFAANVTSMQVRGAKR